MRPSLLRRAAESLESKIPKSISISTIAISTSLVERGGEESISRYIDSDHHQPIIILLLLTIQTQIPPDSIDLLILLMGSASNKSMYMTFRSQLITHHRSSSFIAEISAP